MSRMAGGLLEEVREDPAEVDRRLGSSVVAVLIEWRRICDRVHLHARSPIRIYDAVEGVVVERVGRKGDVPSSEPPADPEQLGHSQMLDEPQETRAARH